MKKSIATILLIVLVFSTVDAQIKKPRLKSNAEINTIKSGIKIKNIKTLSVNQLAAKKIPVLSITEKQRNAKALTSWKIVPNRPKDNWLELKSFYGWLDSNSWKIESSPFFEGSRISSWNPGWLTLNFRQSRDVEYRLKIKIQGTNHRGKSLYVNTGEMSGRYPVNPDGTVHVVWASTTPSRTGTIEIGHLLPNNYKVRDYPQGFPRTSIEYVSIDKI